MLRIEPCFTVSTKGGCRYRKERAVNVLSLFAGVGGFDLGLERAGFHIAALCEIDPYARAILALRFPGVPIYDDARELTAERVVADGIAVDVICGGFPCQDISIVGRRAGLEGEHSGLWAEVARLVRELRPSFLLLENSPSLCVRGLDDILRDLAAIGYDAEWDGIPAATVGAPHLRARQWVLSYPSSVRDRLQTHPIFAGRHSLVHSSRWPGEPQLVRVADGLPARVDRLRCLGNAVVPQIPELIGRAILASIEAERIAA